MGLCVNVYRSREVQVALGHGLDLCRVLSCKRAAGYRVDHQLAEVQEPCVWLIIYNQIAVDTRGIIKYFIASRNKRGGILFDGLRNLVLRFRTDAVDFLPHGLQSFDVYRDVQLHTPPTSQCAISPPKSL